MNEQFTPSKLLLLFFISLFLGIGSCKKADTPEELIEETDEYVFEARAEHDQSSSGIYRGFIRNKHGYGQFKVNLFNEDNTAKIIVFYENELDTLVLSDPTIDFTKLSSVQSVQFVGKRFFGFWKIGDKLTKPVLQIQFNPTYNGLPVTEHPIFLGAMQKELSNVKVHALKGIYTGTDEDTNDSESGTFDGVMLERTYDENNKYTFSGAMIQKDQELGYLTTINLTGLEYSRPVSSSAGIIVTAKFASPVLTGQWDRPFNNFKGTWKAEIIKWF